MEAVHHIHTMHNHIIQMDILGAERTLQAIGRRQEMLKLKHPQRQFRDMLSQHLLATICARPPSNHVSRADESVGNSKNHGDLRADVHHANSRGCRIVSGTSQAASEAALRRLPADGIVWLDNVSLPAASQRFSLSRSFTSCNPLLE
jgi:hypothetical protein